MKKAFLKYQEYCRARDWNEELFKMSQREDESLEYFMERLEYNVQRSGHLDLDLDILKTILLRGIRDEHLEILNLLGKGDISKCYPPKCHLASSEDKDELQHPFSMSLPRFLDNYHYIATNRGKIHDFAACCSSKGRNIVACCTIVTHDDLESQYFGNRVLRWCLGTITIIYF